MVLIDNFNLQQKEHP